MIKLVHQKSNGEVSEVRVISRHAPIDAADEPLRIVPGDRHGRGLRIGVFWSYLCGGGVETVNRDIAEGLPTDKYIVDAFVWQALDTFLPVGRAFDDLIVLNEPFEGFSPQQRLGPYAPVSQGAGFQRMLLEREYDLFIMSCCGLPFWIARMHGIPIIEYWHGFGCWNGWAMPSQAIVAVSETTQRQIEVFRPEHAPATVIRNAVKFERYAGAKEKGPMARERFGLSPTAPVMLYCGRLSPEKRPLDAMTAFVKARETLPDLQLLMIAPLQSDYAVRRGQEMGCRWGQDTFHFALPHDDVELAYAAADVMVHPSEWEGLGMVLLEALAAGVPVISTFAGGCSEVLKGVALKVPVGDTDAMAAAVLEILGDGQLRDRLVRDGRRRVRRDFSLRGNSEKLEKVIEGLVNARPQALTGEQVTNQELIARRMADAQPVSEHERTEAGIT